MTEPLRKYSSSDVPEYSSYPAEPDRVTAEVVDFAVISEFDALPQQDISKYDESARRIGAALGRLVNNLRKMIEPVRSKVEEQYARVEDGVELAKEAAQQSYEDSTRKVRNIARQGICEARARAFELQRKAIRTVDDYPLQTLAVAGVAGVAVGIGLRAWRESHE
jgi:ElaB/YqjD/DUF883 family membrane-anchored ribosome-binding protein